MSYLEQRIGRRRLLVLCAFIASLVVSGVNTALGGTSAHPKRAVFQSGQAGTNSPELFIPSSSVGLNNLSYSANGRMLAGASGLNNNVKVFDARSNVELRLFSGHEAAVTGVAILPRPRPPAPHKGPAFPATRPPRPAP